MKKIIFFITIIFPFYTSAQIPIGPNGVYCPLTTDKQKDIYYALKSSDTHPRYPSSETIQNLKRIIRDYEERIDGNISKLYNFSLIYSESGEGKNKILVLIAKIYFDREELERIRFSYEERLRCRSLMLGRY